MERATIEQKVEAARKASVMLAALRERGASGIMPEVLPLRGNEDLLVVGGLAQLALQHEATKQSTAAE